MERRDRVSASSQRLMFSLSAFPVNMRPSGVFASAFVIAPIHAALANARLSFCTMKRPFLLHGDGFPSFPQTLTLHE